MTTTTLIPPLDSTMRGHAHINSARIIRSEWFKLTHLRSTWIMLGLMFISSVGLTWAIFQTGELADVLEGRQGAAASATALNLISAIIGQVTVIFVVMFGVLAISAEFTSGMMRATLSAAPRRLAVLAAKAIAAAGLTAATLLLTLAAAIPLVLAVFSAKGSPLELEPGQTIQSIGGMLLRVVALTVVALFFGAILRSTAGGISATFGLIWVVPVLFTLVPINWISKLVDWLPDQVTTRAATLPIDGNSVVAGGPLGGLIAILVWLAATAVAAAYLTHRRDA